MYCIDPKKGIWTTILSLNFWLWDSLRTCTSFLLFPDKVNTFLHANSQDILENFPKFCRHFLWQFSRICNKKFKTNSPVLTQPLWMWHVIHPCESWELLYRGSKFSIVKQRQMCFKLCILNVYCKSWKEICIKSAFYQVTLGY